MAYYDTTLNRATVILAHLHQTGADRMRADGLTSRPKLRAELGVPLGWNRQNTDRAVICLLTRGLLEKVDPTPIGMDARTQWFRLTEEGIEAAREVRPEDIRGADNVTDAH